MDDPCLIQGAHTGLLLVRLYCSNVTFSVSGDHLMVSSTQHMMDDTFTKGANSDLSWNVMIHSVVLLCQGYTSLLPRIL